VLNRVVENCSEDGQHLLFQLPMLLVQFFEPLFGRRLVVAAYVEQHLDN